MHRPTHDLLTQLAVARRIEYADFYRVYRTHRAEVDELRTALDEALNAAAFYARMGGYETSHLREAAGVLAKYTPEPDGE